MRIGLKLANGIGFHLLAYYAPCFLPRNSWAVCWGLNWALLSRAVASYGWKCLPKFEWFVVQYCWTLMTFLACLCSNQWSQTMPTCAVKVQAPGSRYHRASMKEIWTEVLKSRRGSQTAITSFSIFNPVYLSLLRSRRRIAKLKRRHLA